MNPKEELLHEIETLLNYKPEQATIINPNYLEYLTLEDLQSIKKSLIAKIGTLSTEDIKWLQQFKKE